MAGIVHFANFFRMMENAEHAFFRSLGFTIHGHESGTTIGWPRVNAACEFLRPLRFEEVVEIQLLVAEVRTRSIRYVFRFWKDAGGQRVEVARGSTDGSVRHGGEEHRQARCSSDSRFDPGRDSKCSAGKARRDFFQTRMTLAA